MIDLHMHTTYSDGTDSLKEILQNANEANLEIISITDHNTCKAYEEMEQLNISELYQGKIIVGTEFTTSFANRMIEVLGYGFDYKKINEYLKQYYTPEKIEENVTILYNRLVKRLNELGIICYIENVKKRKKGSEFFERGIYEEIIKHPENKRILKEDILSSFSDFIRKGLTNPKSELYLNYPELKPSMEEIINVIHEAGGIVFLAHPFQYKIEDIEGFLEKIYRETHLDGIECFYTTFSKEQIEYLINFAKEKNLLISGGSDYHGKNKQKHDLGIGSGNLNINKDIISNWNIKMNG